MTRPARKFGKGAQTPSLATRVALTAATLCLGAMLAARIAREAAYAHVQVPAVLTIALGGWLVGALVTLPYVWRPSQEWKRQRYQAHRLQRRLRAALEPDRDTNLAVLRAKHTPCPVCGQHGPVLSRARTICSACQRPWTATVGGSERVIDLRETAPAAMSQARWPAGR